MTSSEKTGLTRPEHRPTNLSGAGLRVGVVCSRFNGVITERLLEGVHSALQALGVDAKDVTEVWVPGAFETPMAAKALAQSGGLDAVVCLGAVIRGETGHYDFVAGQCAWGIQAAQLDTGVPIAFGVLTTDTVAQAEARAGGSEGNKGAEAAETAVEMADLLRRLAEGTPAGTA